MDDPILICLEAPPEFRKLDTQLLGVEYRRVVLLRKIVKKYGGCTQPMMMDVSRLMGAERFIRAAREDSAFHSFPEWADVGRDADTAEAMKYARDALRAYKRATRWTTARRVKEAAKYYQD